MQRQTALQRQAQRVKNLTPRLPAKLKQQLAIMVGILTQGTEVSAAFHGEYMKRVTQLRQRLDKAEADMNAASKASGRQ